MCLAVCILPAFNVSSLGCCTCGLHILSKLYFFVFLAAYRGHLCCCNELKVAYYPNPLSLLFLMTNSFALYFSVLFLHFEFFARFFACNLSVWACKV